MAIKVTINNGDAHGDVDYTRYVQAETITITKGLNIPTTCKFSINSTDSSFVVPVARAYVKIYSSTNRRYLFTGLIQVDVGSTFLGLSQFTSHPNQEFQVYKFDVSCTSDEYLLNIKSVPFLPAFANKYQGDILTSIAQALAPNYFNFQYVAKGDLVPYMQYDPTQSWSEIAKQFGDASHFRYSVIDKEIHYQPYGDAQLGLTYDESAGEGTFDPSQLNSNVMSTPVINDVTVIGGEEGGNCREDYFVGDGFTGPFLLKHKVFGLGTNFQGSSVLLSDSWQGNTLNAQNWWEQDPAGQFNYANNSLNVLSGFEMPLGVAFIEANNALELAGSTVIQHGEVIFNDLSKGIIGGIYNDATLAPSGCYAGFVVSNGPVVTTSLSGAAGVNMSPFQLNNALTGAFVVTSKVNKSYTLYTRIASPLPVRYHQVFRSLAGTAYGGYQTASTVIGSITWSVLETDLFSAVINQWTWTASNVVLPTTAIYALINNQQLNITLSNTEIWTPTPASLKVQCQIGAGALSPIYISGTVQYTGAFVTPSGGNLPILPANFGPEQQFDFGSGIGNQAGEIDSGSQVDTLNFYGNGLPGVGTRIKLQSWESQVAVSRMRDANSIQSEAQVVGDNGLRSSTIKDLSPLPRTSEDCDNAAAAILADKVATWYQGTYTAKYYFFSQYTNDIDFYPVCGRYLYVNSSKHRGIINQNMLVTAVTMTIEEMHGEIVVYAITFGPDLYEEKVLAAIVPYPKNVLEPIDTAIQPTPQYLTQLGTNYLPDIFQTTVQGFINGGTFALNFCDQLGTGTNALLNPNFNGSSGWVYETGWAYQPVTFGSGSGAVYTGQGTAAVSNQGTVTCKSGDLVTASCWAMGAIGANGVATPRITFFDALNHQLGINNGDSGATANGQWAWRSITYQAPSNTAWAVIDFAVYNSTNNIPWSVTQFVAGIVNAMYEVRSGDINWGSNDNFLLFRLISNQVMTIPRSQYDQSWFIRQVSNIGTPQFAASRRTKVIRIMYPRTPTTPLLLSADTSQVQMDFSGDIRNVEGLEIRQADDATVCFQTIVGTRFDMSLDMNLLRNNLLPGQQGYNGLLGKYLINPFDPNSRLMNAHFFNLMWEYGPTLAVSMPALNAPTVTPGYRWGPTLVLKVAANPLDYGRSDIVSTHVQVASDAGFTQILQDISQTGNPGIITTTTTIKTDIYVRAQYVDNVGVGTWSSTLFIPRGDLIASDYLAAQGSIPPTIVANLAASGGGIFSYLSPIGGHEIDVISQPFNIFFPNGSYTINIPAATGVYTRAVDTGPLTPVTLYAFYPAIRNPTTGNPSIIFNGPFQNYGGTATMPALTGNYADGVATLTNGALVVQTASASSTMGGTAGGTYGGGYGASGCGIRTSRITLASGLTCEVAALYPGVRVRTPTGLGVIDKVMQMKAPVYTFVAGSGLTGCASETHTLKSHNRWLTIETIGQLLDDGEEVAVWTKNDLDDKLIYCHREDEERYVMKIHLVGATDFDEVEHYYLLDGFWAHNMKVGPGGK
jgi:hypothetical protein